MKKLLYLLLSLYVVLLLYSFIKNLDLKVTDQELSHFITEHNIQNASIKKMNSKKYYIFSEQSIFVYEGKHTYSETKNISKQNIIFGGLQKGSVGLLIHNTNVLTHGKLYSVTIDNITRNYEYHGEKYLIISDGRIWNPTPQLSISFLDINNNVLYQADI